MCRHRLLAILLTSIVLVTSTAYGDLVNWTDPAGGDFQDPANWTPSQIPGVNDTAIFDLATGGYTVSTTQDVSTASLIVRHEVMSLALGSHSWTLPQNNTLTTFIGEQASDVATLTFESGTVNSGRTVVGNSGNANGKLVVNGPNAVFAVGNSALFAGLADTSHGAIEVRGGGTLSVAGDSEPRVYIASTPTSTGSILVTGNGSVLRTRHNPLNTINASVNVGQRGTGELTVTDHGIVDLGAQIQVGGTATAPGPNSSGVLTITGGGVLSSTLALSPTGTSGLLARDATSHGEVHVSGLGSQWTQDGDLGVGWAGLGTLDIDHAGVVESRRGHLGRLSTANGTVSIVDAGSRWTVVEDLTVGGTEVAQGGQGLLDVDLGGQVVVGQTLRSWHTGTIDVTGGGTIKVGSVASPPAAGSVVVGSGGVLSGSGTILGNIVVDGGTVIPGASPGVLHITGNYSQAVAGVLAMEIGGTTPGTEYDQLLVSGNLNVAGPIQISLLNGFMPHVGDMFDLLSASSLDVSGPISFLNGPAGLDFTTAQSNGVFSITVTAVPEPATLLSCGVGLVSLIGVRGRFRTMPRADHLAIRKGRHFA